MSNTHDYTHSGSAYSREEWEASARYAEEHASEIEGSLWSTPYNPPTPEQEREFTQDSLAQHIFDTMTAQNQALAAYWRKQR